MNNNFYFNKDWYDKWCKSKIDSFLSQNDTEEPLLEQQLDIIRKYEKKKNRISDR